MLMLLSEQGELSRRGKSVSYCANVFAYTFHDGVMKLAADTLSDDLSRFIHRHPVSIKRFR